MRLVFVRHGQSVANAEGWLAGALDTPLTELGRQQAEQARDQLPEGLEVAWSSDLVRAEETARLLLNGRMRLSTTSALRERNMGPWASRQRKLLGADDRQRLLSWEDAPEGAESQAQVARRCLEFLSGLEDRDTLVVAHGGVLRVVTGLLDGLPRERIGERKVRNVEFLVRQTTPARLRELLESL